VVEGRIVRDNVYGSIEDDAIRGALPALRSIPPNVKLEIFPV
jgi:hypothetical protein